MKEIIIKFTPKFIRKCKGFIKNSRYKKRCTILLKKCERIKKKQFSFIIGTGGSGTQWCANAFTDNKDTICYHDLSKYTLSKGHYDKYSHHKIFYKHGLKRINPNIDHKRKIDVVKKGYLDPIFLRMYDENTCFVGDADSFLSIFAEDIFRKYPSAKFLFVVRNGINNITWYLRREGIDNVYRLEKGFIPNWEQLTWFEKACTWWKNKNEIIYNLLKEKIPQDNYMMSNLEKLTHEDDAIKKAWSFLELPFYDKNIKRIKKISKERIGKYKMTPSTSFISAEEIWKKWDEDKRGVFKEICGSTMTLFGYEIPKE